MWFLVLCKGGNDFDELYASKALALTGGSVLRPEPEHADKRISWPRQNVLFWRSFFVLFLHYIAILMTGSLSLRLGFFSQVVVETQVDESIERPSEDSATMYAFIK